MSERARCLAEAAPGVRAAAARRRAHASTLPTMVGLAVLLAGAPGSALAEDGRTRVLRLGGEGSAAALEAELALLELQLLDAEGDVPVDRAGALRLLEAWSAAVLLVRPNPPRLFVLRCGRVRERLLPAGEGFGAALLTAELVVATLAAPCAPSLLVREGGGGLTAPVALGLTRRGSEGDDFDEVSFGDAELRDATPRETPEDALPPPPAPWGVTLTVGPTFDLMGRRSVGQADLTVTRVLARGGSRALHAGLRLALPLGALRGGDERTTATVHAGAADLTLEGRWRRGGWTLVTDAGPALLWARIRVDDTPGPLQPSYPLLGARGVFGAMSAGFGVERQLADHLGLRLGVRLRHALPGGVALRRTPQEEDASPGFFRFGSQLGLAAGLRFR